MDDIEINPLKEETDVIEGSNYEPSKFKVIRKNDTGFLVLIVLSGSMFSLYLGLSFVWPSSVIPKLESNVTEENPLGRRITTFETSMLAGLPIIGILLGPIVIGYVSELVGRKGSIEIASLGIIISILALSSSTNIICIITFRCGYSFFVTGAANVFFIYVIEICEDHNRAKYSCLALAFSPIGYTLGYSIGAALNFKNFNLVELSPMILLFIFFFLAPESPIYNLSKHKIEKCMKDIKRLRHNKSERELQIDLRNIYSNIQTSKKLSEEKMLLIKLVSTKEKRYSLMLASSLAILQIFCAFGIIIPFMEPIFIATETKFNSSHLPIIAASFKVIACIAASFIVEKCGRRPLLIISAMGSGVPLLILGCFFYLKYIESPLIHQMQWLPLACIISYILLSSFGIFLIPLVTIGELFTPDVRSTGISVVSIVFSMLLFFSSGTYPYIVEYIGMHWCLWLYGSLSLLSALIIYLIIPETSGKSINEIQVNIKALCNK
ncbi:facilitated trehalose transporter Tret1-like [Diorhabda sublineata]|uniref:facilitated trehalose transporter Tret1-like n=1 Tax=Diorhabda sublineata TaxID=1163346 RepID=UPI0024E13E29|nr:facilitated trehalose transporter Tret1-like [Diorhabda sublineata]XP_056631722.1 facilitated trehalose transporter Tret1-like [Diorhabda sublineata]